MYISRSLAIAKGSAEERVIAESEITAFGLPLVIVGEPGIGKTMLTEKLAIDLGTLNVTAGRFQRCRDLSRLRPPEGKPIIIDGLDEISPTSGFIVDEVLGKLSELGNPPFILSCRAADWEGSLASQKILEDYGSRPTILHLSPFTHQDATGFLAAEIGQEKAASFLGALENSGLFDLVGNPWTLKLLAKLASDSGALPSTRAELFERACPKLVSEQNQSHQRRPSRKVSENDLLVPAGAIFAHLLLSQTVGIDIGSRNDHPVGYISEAELPEPNSEAVGIVLKSRLFRNSAEETIVPVHRSIAEYLAARWLGERLAEGFSERRLFQVLNSSRGVPSALRGVHAWLAHFYPPVASRCIAADPFGVLRYGDINKLGTKQARELLRALASLAEEDPFFRTEDWAARAARGLAKSELKADILNLISSNNSTNFHLSTLLLEALKGSRLAEEIAPELRAILQSQLLTYAERRRAMDALLQCAAEVQWSHEIEALSAAPDSDSARLAIELICKLPNEHFSPELIATALVAHHGLDDSKRLSRIEVGFGLAKVLTPDQSLEVVNLIIERLKKARNGNKWKPSRSLAIAALRLFSSTLDQPRDFSPEDLFGFLEPTT